MTARLRSDTGCPRGYPVERVRSPGSRPSPARPRSGSSRAVVFLVRFLLLWVILVPGLRAELEVNASKTFELRSMSVQGDFSQFLVDNPLYLSGNEFEQNLRLEVTGSIGEKVHVDVMLDDSIYQDEEKRMRVDVSGRVWNLSLGRFPLMLEGSRFLMAPRTGLGAFLRGTTNREVVEAFVQRPEGKTQRNFFEGKGALQEYVLTDSSGLANPLVVVGSERVVLDGRLLERGVDYEMDYLEGAVLLSQHLLPLDERNRLSVEFEEAGEGSGLRSTFFGGRYTREFGPTREARVSLGFAGEVDQLSEDASTATTGISPHRLGVVELAAQVPLARGLIAEGRAALSSLDEDTRSEEGDHEPVGAYDLKLTYGARLFDLTLGRSVVEPGFQGVGLDRFQTAGERRFASRDGSVSFLQGTYRPHADFQARASYQEAESNLSDLADEAREDVRTATFEVDTRGVLGGEVDLRYLGEASQGRAAGATEEARSGKDRFSVVHSRRLGRIGVQFRGELEETYRDQEALDSYQLAGVEFTGPTTSSVTWSTGGSLRAVHQGDAGDPSRLETDARAGVQAEVGEDLSLGLDLQHRRIRNRDPSDTSRAPREETNTGEARFRYLRGERLEVETVLTGEVRSRVFLDGISEYQANLDARSQDLTAQTALTPNPVLNRGSTSQVLFRPSRKVELGGGYRWSREADIRTDELYSREEGGDGRVTWTPSEHWKTSLEASQGASENPVAGNQRDNLSSRVEVLRSFPRGSNLSLRRTLEDVDDHANPDLSERTLENRLGLEHRIRRGLVAKAGLHAGAEQRVARSETQGFDAGLEWTQPRTGSRLGMGVDFTDVRGTGSDGEDQESLRKKWFLSAAGRLGEEGFVDLGLELTSAGADARGGEGYRALTTNLKLGLEF